MHMQLHMQRHVNDCVLGILRFVVVVMIVVALALVIVVMFVVMKKPRHVVAFQYSNIMISKYSNVWIL